MADDNKPNRLNGFGNIASSAINAGLGLYSLHQQKKENEKTREYNLKLAQMQNQWNVEQWQRENDYNMPANQIARLKAAGLNPDLIYGGGVENTSATSPQMTAGAAGSPMDWSSLANINPVNSYLDAQLKQAQIDNINADTNKKGAETSILTDEKAFKKAILQGQLDLNNAQINLIGKQGDLTSEQIKETQLKCVQIEAYVREIYANIGKITNDIEISKVLSDAQIKEIASRCNLNDSQAFSIVKQLPAVINKLNADTANSQAHANLAVEQLGQLEIGRDAVEFDARIRSFKSGKQDDLTAWQHVMMFTSQVLTALGSFLPKK